MRIKVLKCCAGLKFSYSAGETVDADNKTAKDLIQAGYAEEVQAAQVEEVKVEQVEEGKSGGKGNNSAGKRTGKS
ncbi:MAG: hypothetical protein ACFWUC_13230 [Oscillospiraceae bacterium]|jgi:hypothetical protein